MRLTSVAALFIFERGEIMVYETPVATVFIIDTDDVIRTSSEEKYWEDENVDNEDGWL